MIKLPSRLGGGPNRLRVPNPPQGRAPEDKLTLVSLSEDAPEAALLASTALKLSETKEPGVKTSLAAQAAQAATLAALAATPSGPVNQVLAQVAIDAMSRVEHPKDQVAIGRTYLETLDDLGYEQAGWTLARTSKPNPNAASAHRAALSQLLPSDEASSPRIRKSIDPEADPGQDFDQFANGPWLELATYGPPPKKGLLSQIGCVFSEDEPQKPREKKLVGRTSRSAEGYHRVDRFVKETLEEAKSAPEGSELHLLRLFQESAQDEKRENTGLGRLGPLLERLQTSPELTPVLTEAHRLGVQVPFAALPTVDDRGGDQVVLGLDPVITIPDPRFYTRPEDQNLRKTYRNYMVELFIEAGEEPAVAACRAQRAFAVEKRLAAHLPTPEQREDLERLECSSSELSERFPGLDWATYTKASLKGYEGKVMVTRPEFFKALAQEVAQGGDEVRDFLAFRMLDDTAKFRTPQSERSHFAFHQQSLGGGATFTSAEHRTRAKLMMCLNQVLFKSYVEQTFTPETRQKVEKVFCELKTVFRRRIEASELSPEGKGAAQKKLANMKLVLGHPQEWPKTDGIELTDDNLFENVCRLSERAVASLVDRLSGSREKLEADRVPVLDVNAYYVSRDNSVIIPAAFLQPPYYYEDEDEASLYGSLATHIGHEMTHGFDPMGMQFGPDREHRSLWTGADAELVEQSKEAIVRHAESFDLGIEEKMNGNLVAPESMADLGGVSLAFEAFQNATAGKTRKTLEGLSPEQRFFVRYAQSRAWAYTDDALRVQIREGEHPPPKFRINGLLSHLPTFAASFGLAPTAAMALAESQRARTW